jgi:hypothetical protein
VKILTRMEWVSHFDSALLHAKDPDDHDEFSYCRNVLDAHDAALRAEVERLTKERDEAKASMREVLDDAYAVTTGRERARWDVIKADRDKHKARADRYRKAIKDAPHAIKCSYSYCGQEPCDCWKRAALAGEEEK